MKKKSISYAYDDARFLEHLMEKGRSYAAASFELEQTKEKLVREFHEKTEILDRHFKRITVVEFLETVFPDIDRYMVVTSGEVGEKKNGTYDMMDMDDLIRYQSIRSDVFVSPCSFIQDCFKIATCKNIYAFVIDVDKVKPSVIDNTIKNGTLGNRIPMPTFFVNSGEGLHLYYVFNKPVPFFKKNRSTLLRLYKGLFNVVKNNIAAKADDHSLIQPFRLPGSLTKLDQVVTGFVANKKWDIHALAMCVGVDFDGDMIQLDVLPQKEYNKIQKKRRTGEKCPKCGLELVYRKSSSGERFIGCTGYPRCRFMKTTDGKLIQKKTKKTKKIKRANKGFYEYCLEKVYERTEQGNRYLSMVALVIVAYKTDVPKEVVEKDLNELVDHYNQIGAMFRQREVQKALRAYNQKALLTPSEKLEEYFGWDFRRKGKEDREERDRFYAKEQERVYKFTEERRKQLEKAGAIDESGKIISRKRYALFRARETRDRNQSEIGQKWDDASGRKSKKAIVEGWQIAHPEGKKADCVRETGLSKPTVYKWWNNEIMNSKK